MSDDHDGLTEGSDGIADLLAQEDAIDQFGFGNVVGRLLRLQQPQARPDAATGIARPGGG